MSDFKINKELDITGEVCPFTFVKSKLVLETMEKGEVLRVIVDYEPSAVSVPKSMRDEGQEVLATNKIGDNKWEIIVRKAR
ncbi:MAG: sulfurtransferase TusA family protein [Hydrogenobaculum sp.]|jgi:TusA-related sulfurtransferase